MEDNITPQEMVVEIIKLLGKKQGITQGLTKVNSYHEVYGVYHWRGEVCCLKGGMDIDFLLLPNNEQITVYNHIINGDMEIDNTIQ